MNAVVVLCYILVLAAFIFILLFGQSQQFEGTVVQKLHWFITEGLCEYSGSCVVKVGGKRGQKLIDLFGEYYCDRPNPTLQIFYLALVTCGYLIFVNYSFDRLPGPFLSEIHWYTGPFAVLLSLGVFFLASFSDPGTITADNVDRHLFAYPYDHVLYVPKMCRTMRIPAPARSKFDGITNRRVARFDHFCSWMNNAIGALALSVASRWENNYRYFLSFLFLHIFLFVYAAAFFLALIAGEVVKRGVLEVPFPGQDGGQVWLWQNKALLVQWILYHFSAEAMLAAFVAFTTLLVSGFLAYHLTLIARGTTTYESFKWRDLRTELLERAAEDAAREREQAAQDAARGRGRGDAAAAGGGDGGDGDGGAGGPARGGGDAAGGGSGAAASGWSCPGFLGRALRALRCRRAGRRRRGGAALAALVSPADLEEIDRLCVNSYKKPFWAALWDVLYPRSGRPEVVAAAEQARRAREEAKQGRGAGVGAREGRGFEGQAGGEGDAADGADGAVGGDRAPAAGGGKTSRRRGGGEAAAAGDGGGKKGSNKKQ